MNECFSRNIYSITVNEHNKLLRGHLQTSGYANNPEKITIFKFPRDVTECMRWVNSLPNKLPTDNESNKSIPEKTKYLGICEKHWLEHLFRLTYQRL